MRFKTGQKYRGKHQQGLTAEVQQLDDDGRRGWVEVRDEEGKLIGLGEWVVYAQFIEHWTLVEEGEGSHVGNG